VLALCTVADLAKVGITGPAAVSIAAFFGNVEDEEHVVPLPLPSPPPPREAELEPELESNMNEPELEAPCGPMVEFDGSAVLAWLSTVPGLTAAQRAAVAQMMTEDEYDGDDLVHTKSKALARLLKGSGAEEAVPLLLAARDAHLAVVDAVERARADARAAAEAAQQAAIEAADLIPPDEFVCAISQQLMVDPVTTGAGQTYEREAIATWLR
jgi:hypothetical protein